MWKLITIIINSIDEGAFEKPFPEDLKCSLEKYKQPPCVPQFTFFLKPSSFIKPSSDFRDEERDMIFFNL